MVCIFVKEYLVMITQKWLQLVFIGAALAVLLFILCALPIDPNDPSNTSLDLVVRNSSWDESNTTITDSVGNTLLIGMILHLPSNIDSVRLHIVNEEETTVADTLFIWTAPLNASGEYRVKFTVTDNGSPALSDSLIVFITVAADSVNHAPLWNTDTLHVSLTDTGSYSLHLQDSCQDGDGDSVVFTLLPGGAAGDTIAQGSYVLEGANLAPGMYSVMLVATDPEQAKDTLVLLVTVQFSPSSGVQLASLKITAGSVTEVLYPVPDTIRDTVSFIDSTIALILGARDTLTTFTVNTTVVSTGVLTRQFPLAIGGNTLTITTTDPDKRAQATYTLVVVRKPQQPLLFPCRPMGKKRLHSPALQFVSHGMTFLVLIRTLSNEVFRRIPVTPPLARQQGQCSPIRG